MRVVKKEKFYVNSLNTTLPASDNVITYAPPTLLPFKDVKKQVYKERLVHFKGNAVQAAKSLQVQRNCFIKFLGADVIEQVRQEAKNKDKSLFLDAYKLYNGNTRLIANRLQMSKSTVSNLMVKYNLKARHTRTTKVKLNKPVQLNLFNEKEIT